MERWGSEPGRKKPYGRFFGSRTRVIGSIRVPRDRAQTKGSDTSHRGQNLNVFHLVLNPYKRTLVQGRVKSQVTSNICLARILFMDSLESLRTSLVVE